MQVPQWPLFAWKFVDGERKLDRMGDIELGDTVPAG